MTFRIRAKVLLHLWLYDFYDMTLSTVACYLLEYIA